MCGIAGYYGSREFSDDRLRACEALMKRRGPDAFGMVRHKSADGRTFTALHSRLSIIDLDPRSNQPFEAGSGSLVYNGEIYNFLELRAELAEAGVRFETTSDTEVLYRLMERKGAAAAMNACEGMWAFAWFDPAASRLLLSRDRFGEKPLYYLVEDGGIFFASEPKFIFALRGRRLAPNKNHVRRYLVNGYKSLYKTGETFFEGLKEVQSGTFLSAGLEGDIREERYWRAVPRVDESLTFASAAEKVREALIQSVKLRLRADVPLAFCMSGGVDSNSLISIAKKVLKYDVHGFTIVNRDKRYEEQDMIEHSVKELGLRHTQVRLRTEGFLDGLRQLVAYHDSPVCTVNYYAHWLLMQQISEAGYKISISGTGADELFSGYYDHHLFYLAQIRGDGALHAERKAEWEKHVKPIVRNRLLQDPDVFAKTPGFRDHIFMDADEYRSFLTSPWREDFREERFVDDNFRNRMINELFHEIVPPILHEDDLNAMYYSVENRSPFLDRPLFELAFSVPTRFLIKGGMAKVLLREAMKGIAPARILESPRKVGFNAPISDLLNLRDSAVKEAVLADSPIFGIVRREAVAEMLRKTSFSENDSKFVFYFLSSKLFLEECS